MKCFCMILQACTYNIIIIIDTFDSAYDYTGLE